LAFLSNIPTIVTEIDLSLYVELSVTGHLLPIKDESSAKVPLDKVQGSFSYRVPVSLELL
jgi:hypothetical protein